MNEQSIINGVTSWLTGSVVRGDGKPMQDAQPWFYHCTIEFAAGKWEELSEPIKIRLEVPANRERIQCALKWGDDKVVDDLRKKLREQHNPIMEK